MKKLLIILLFSFAHTLYGQSISILDIDTTNFPTMKAKFFAFDKDGNQVSPSASELIITENGINRKITNVSCPPAFTPKSLSVGIIVDTYSYIDLTRNSVSKLVEYLNFPKDEVGITYMAKSVLIYQDFTKDKSKALSKASAIPSAPGVDINAMFNSKFTGGIPFISPRKNEKKILILITDLHCPNLNIDEKKLYEDCQKNNISIYTFIINKNDYTGLFHRMAENTKGKVFEYLSSENQISNIFKDVINESRNNIPCDLTWESEVVCNSIKVNTELSFKTNQSSQIYQLPSTAIARLNVNPLNVLFGKISNPTIKDTIITLTAINSDFTINDIKLKYGSSIFSIVNTNFPILISKNTSKDITLRCTPIDSSINYVSFEVESNLCNFFLSAYCGYPTVKIKTKTLKLTKPNGGEAFLAGSDTLITWEGVSENDLVDLNYSIDSGKTWSNIVKNVSGFKYVWKNIPLPQSTKCLVQVFQIPDPLNTGKFGDVQFNTFTHSKGYYDVEVSPDEKYIATCSENVLIIWDKKDYINLKSLHTEYPIKKIKWHPNSNIVALEHEVPQNPKNFENVTVWNVKKDEKIFGLNYGNINWSNDGNSFLTSYKYEIEIWDSKNENNLFSYKLNPNYAYNSIKWSPDNNYIICSYSDTLLLIDIKSNITTKIHFSLNPKEYNKHTFLYNWSYNSQKVAVCHSEVNSNNKSVFVNIYDVNSKKLFSSFQVNQSVVRSIEWSYNNNYIAFNGYDQVNIININTGKLVNKLNGNFSNLTDLSWSKDDKYLLTSGEESLNKYSTRLWDLSNGNLVNSFSDNLSTLLLAKFNKSNKEIYTFGNNYFYCLDSLSLIPKFKINALNMVFMNQWSPDMSKIAKASNMLTLWDATNGKFLNEIGYNINQIRDFNWSPNGNFIAVYTGGTNIEILNTTTGLKEFNLIGHKGMIYNVAWSPDKNLLASASVDSTLIIWDIWNNKILYKLTDNYKFAGEIQFNYDGTKLAKVNGDQSINVWDVKTGKKLYNIVSNNSYSFLKWNFDSKLIACGSFIGIDVWDIENSKLISTSKEKSNYQSVDWSNDGRFICAKTALGDLLIINPLDGSTFKKIQAHNENIYNAKFSFDGSLIATNSLDNTVKIWEVLSGKLLLTLQNEVWQFGLSWSPDGQRLASSKIWYMNRSLDILQEDQSDAVFSIIAPETDIQNLNIDMGKVVVGSAKDSTVTALICNKGKAPLHVLGLDLTAGDVMDFMIPRGAGDFYLQPNECQDVMFDYMPMNLGKHSAKITVRTTIGDYQDTINIIGEGIQPSFQVLNDLIDFGKVLVKNEKDSLKAITIKNTGIIDLNITNTYHLGPNDIDYTTIAGGGKFVLKAGDTAKLDLKFKPSDIGRTSGRLMFDFDAPGSPAMVQLFGEGVDKGAEIQSVSAISLRNLICESSVLDSVQIKNIGNDILTIDSIKLSGLNQSDFVMQKNLPFDIDTNSLDYIPILFKSNTIGNKSAIIEVYSNSLNNNVLKININSKKDSINISSNNTNINLGYLCPNETKDTIIYLNNFGTLPTGFRIKLPIDFSSIETKTNLNQNEKYNYAVRFLGLPNEGNFNGTLTITDSICNKSQTINYSGIIEIPKVVIDMLEINTTQGNIQSGDILVHNNGNRELILNTISGLNNPFSLKNITFPIKIPANSTTKISVNYQSTSSLKDSINITFNFNSCNLVLKSDIIGITKLPTITLKVGSIEAKVGEVVEIPIYLLNGLSLSKAGVTGINADITVNNTVLYSLDNFSKTYIDDSLKLSLNNISIQTNNLNEIVMLKFKTALGNSDYSSLKLSNVQTIGNKLDITLIDGKLTLTDVCYDGGVRFLNGTTQTNLFAIFPNPANDNIEIEYSNADNGLAEFKFINVMGEVVSYIQLEKTQNGKAKMNLKNLHSGQYFGVFNTESINQNMIISVIR